jgi:hypothetical protein
MKALVRAATLCVGLSVLAIASCGDSDEDKVRAVAQLVADQSPARCDYMTSKFIEDSYKSESGCRKKRNDSRPGVIEKIAVEGERARATVNFQGFHSKLKLRKESGDWRIQSFDYTVDPNSERARLSRKLERGRKSETRPEAKIRMGLTPVETVNAYYKAIRTGDGAGFCGLISRGHAARLLGEASDTPLIDCAEALQDYDWSKTRKLARGVRTVAVERSGRDITVTLTQGKRAMLKREHSRWVLDSVEKNRTG